jgi:hypothetical protein
MKQGKINNYGSRLSYRIGLHCPVVLDVLDYLTAARDAPCPEEKNAPKWG